MLSAQAFVETLHQRGFDFFTGTPCSYLAPLMDCVSSQFEFVTAVNEGDAVALAAGAYLAGARPVVLFQNSGLGNALNPLSSLTQTFGLPLLGIVSLRGDPEAALKGVVDAPQHRLMGRITPALLDLLEIPWAAVPPSLQELKTAMKEVLFHFERGRPYFWVLRKHDLLASQLQPPPLSSTLSAPAFLPSAGTGGSTDSPEEHIEAIRLPRRTEVLRLLQAECPERGMLIATTGKTGRELEALADRPNQLYMVGSMGCALSIGLGINRVQAQRPLWVIDGDGALLMRTGSLSTAGRLASAQLKHIVLDNAMHDSTGGQPSYSEQVDFARVAHAMGYARADTVYELSELSAVLKIPQGPHFIRMHIQPGSPSDLGRPELSPQAVANRLRDFLSQS